MDYSNIMPLDSIPDWDCRLARQDAFWQGDILDRPLVTVVFRRPDPGSVPPTRRPDDKPWDRWLNAQYQAETALYRVRNTAYMGDALPVAWPNLGRDIFSAYLGMELEFGNRGPRPVPMLESLHDTDGLSFTPNNSYWHKTIEIVDALLEAGKGLFYTGTPELHPGGDALAGLRGPLRLTEDVRNDPETVVALREQVDGVFRFVARFFSSKLSRARQPSTNSTGIASSLNWHVCACDFAALVSRDEFRDVFVPGIRSECGLFDFALFRLEGLGALRHLNTILDLPEVTALEWVPGAGKGTPLQWIDVYRACQAAGKGVRISVHTDELEALLEVLRPQGVWLSVTGVTREDHADAVIWRVGDWR